MAANRSAPIPARWSASALPPTGSFAGIRSANHLRAVLAHIGMEVIAPQVSVPHGAEAFDDAGNFKEERLRKGMTRVCKTLIEHARLLSTRFGVMSAADVSERLIVGLDVPTRAEAEKVVRELDGIVSFYKIGYQLAFAGGLDLARELAADGIKIFLDMKLLDIDNTVAQGRREHRQDGRDAC